MRPAGGRWYPQYCINTMSYLYSTESLALGMTSDHFIGQFVKSILRRGGVICARSNASARTLLAQPCCGPTVGHGVTAKGSCSCSCTTTKAWSGRVGLYNEPITHSRQVQLALGLVASPMPSNRAATCSTFHDNVVPHHTKPKRKQGNHFLLEG